MNHTTLVKETFSKVLASVLTDEAVPHGFAGRAWVLSVSELLIGLLGYLFTEIIQQAFSCSRFPRHICVP